MGLTVQRYYVYTTEMCVADDNDDNDNCDDNKKDVNNNI